MKFIGVYNCLCDETRLRILNLLIEGPLCVCHLVEILKVSQPNISRHLKALRKNEAIVSERCHNWTIYRLPEKRGHVLASNLKCLQDLRREEPVFREDLRRRSSLIRELKANTGDMPGAMACLIQDAGINHKS